MRCHAWSKFVAMLFFFLQKMFCNAWQMRCPCPCNDIAMCLLWLYLGLDMLLRCVWHAVAHCVVARFVLPCLWHALALALQGCRQALAMAFACAVRVHALFVSRLCHAYCMFVPCLGHSLGVPFCCARRWPWVAMVVYCHAIAMASPWLLCA